MYHDPVDDVYLVTRHADVLAGFSDVTRFSNRLYRKTLGRVFGPTMLEMDGADHIQRRKVVSPVFAPTRLEAFYPLVESVVGSLLDDVAGETCFDLVSHLANRLPGTVIVHLLGFPS
ncbi:MAG: hypothetical protein KatS3mg011_2290 [Acidimicrobiia bacterium]|nr:MAG: hypothetical protein KatS3mg011_2290 [Acidimicrobiia bacterium]